MLIDVVTKFKNDNMLLPEYAHTTDAGMDLRANIEKPVHLVFGETVLIPTGIFIALPPSNNIDWNWELQIRPRSGLAYKRGITVLNSPGTIDQGYRKEIGVLLHNTRKDVFVVEPGDRIAQGVLSKAYRVQWNICSDLSDSDRLDGFGHTGVS